MPADPLPRIEILDDRYVELTEDIQVPVRFRAVFDGMVLTSVEIEMVDGSPVVRSVTMSTMTDDLAGKDLRQPLRSRLVPAAMAAACRERLFGPSDDEVGNGAAKVDLSDQVTLEGNRHGHTDDYRGAPVRSQRGRPRRVPDPNELAQVAGAYLERRSLSDVMARFPGISKTTAWRRVNEARDAGLIPNNS